MEQKFTKRQSDLINAMKSGSKLYASYPIPFVSIDARIESGNSLTFIDARTFVSLIKRKVIGNAKLKTNRHYEFFLINQK